MVKKDFQNYFSTKSYSSISQISKCETGSLHEKRKYYKVPKFCTDIRFFKCDCMSKKIFWKYCFNPKLHVWFCYKIWKGVFRAHCTQIWGTSRLAVDRHMFYSFTLSSVYGEERFPKLFFYKKLFVHFPNIKMRNGLIARKAKVLRCPNFAQLDFLSVTVWAKKYFENIVSIQSYVYDFVTKFGKVCLGLIAPKFEVPQGWPSTGTC